MRFDQITAPESRFEEIARPEDLPQVRLFTALVNSPHFGHDLRILVLVDARDGSYAVLCTTDLAQIAEDVVAFFRLRFLDETSYRLSKQLRGWTPSSSSAYRFVLIGLSCFMVNVWVHLCWLYTQVARRGGRYLDADRFRLQRYAKFIMQALERQYGRGQEIFAPAVPLP